MVDNDASFSYSNTVKVRLKYQSSFSIFPNPASNHLVVSLISSLNETAKLSILDHTGRKLYKQDILIKKGNNSFSINTLWLLPGAYILSVNGNNNYFWIIYRVEK